jgi:hypothetical protein
MKGFDKRALVKKGGERKKQVLSQLLIYDGLGICLKYRLLI